MSAVAFDATLWDEPITGIGLYTRELHRALCETGLEVQRWGARHSGEAPRGRISRTGWTLGHLPAWLQARQPSLYHAVSNFNLPLQRTRGVPYVLTVHDLVPLLLPETVSARFRWQFRLWLARSLEVAQQVICVSETTRKSVLERFSVNPRKLHVVHHGVDHVERVAPPDVTTVKWLDALGLETPWVLYAGALDARKNVELVLRAIERLHDGGQRVTLVLAGQRWFGSGRIEQELRRVRDRGVDVRPLGYLADPVFYALMKRAGVFIFPSRYEGFGLPPLEAMRLGVPTIISTEGSLPEICGDGAAQVAPDDVNGLAELLSSWLTSSSERERWAGKAKARAADFSWRNAARLTASLYSALR
ncbi:MAG: glycosyltransferase family 1 protein [Archangium sp.]|nr:glycosyltransferase family 1 protein [Archangium sp.]